MQHSRHILPHEGDLPSSKDGEDEHRGSDGHSICQGYLSYDMDNGDISRGKKEN